MNYTHCKTLHFYCLLASGIFFVLAVITRVSRLSVLYTPLLILACAGLISHLPIWYFFWKCPHCGAHLTPAPTFLFTPWNHRNENASFPYRCTNCGKDVDF